MAWLRHSWQNAHITPLASKDTVKELMRVLAYPKFKLSKDEQALLLADFLPYTETVIIEQIPDDLPRGSRTSRSIHHRRYRYSRYSIQFPDSINYNLSRV